MQQSKLKHGEAALVSSYPTVFYFQNAARAELKCSQMGPNNSRFYPKPIPWGSMF